MAITDWPADERPREKLLQRGPAALSDAELLAIFLRVGIVGKSAVDLSRDLLAHFGSLASLFSASQPALCAIPGMGSAKYAQLQAVLEMARRSLAEQLRRDDAFDSPHSVANYLRLRLARQPREVFMALFLDNRHRLLAAEELFHGSLSQASVHPREVVKRALMLNAAAVIVAHNHPSGDSEPSAADILLTRQLRAALELVEIRLLDHFIIGDQALSLAERGLV